MDRLKVRMSDQSGKSYPVHASNRYVSSSVSLRSAFELLSKDNKCRAVYKPQHGGGYQSLPASRSSSFTSSSRSSSPSSSSTISLSPSSSREQSFTYIPPSYKDASFIPWVLPNQRVYTTSSSSSDLVRSRSTPTLPAKKYISSDRTATHLSSSIPPSPTSYGVNEIDGNTDKVRVIHRHEGRDVHQDIHKGRNEDRDIHTETYKDRDKLTNMDRYKEGYENDLSVYRSWPGRREACIVGWEEVEETKRIEYGIGKVIYKCSYCNQQLRGEKNYVVTWPRVLYCKDCKDIPYCHACYKKAVPMIYVDSRGNTVKSEALKDYGGLSICGQCVLTNPITDDNSIDSLVKRGRALLHALFTVEFDESLLTAYRQPHVLASLQSTLHATDLKEQCYLIQSLPSLHPRTFDTCAHNPIHPYHIHSTHSNDNLPFLIRSVWHLLLCSNNITHAYGRCETRLVKVLYSSEQYANADNKGNALDTCKHYMHASNQYDAHNNNKREVHAYEDEVHANNKRDISAGRKEENKGDTRIDRTYRVVQRILLSRGIPEALLLGHLVHELLHAYVWLYLDDSNITVDRTVEEGLCNCILAAALQERVEYLKKRREMILLELINKGVKPRTSPNRKEMKGISETEKFLIELIRKNAKKMDITDVYSAVDTPHMSIPALEYHLYVAEYELKVLNRRLSEMEKDMDPAYGVGYRTIRDILMKLNISKIMQIIKQCGNTLDHVVKAASHEGESCAFI